MYPGCATRWYYDALQQEPVHVAEQEITRYLSGWAFQGYEQHGDENDRLE